MGEEWRLLIELDAEGALARVANEIIGELGNEVGLHRADDALVAYADSAEGARAVERRLRAALERHALGQLEPSVEHWDHAEQRWADAAGNPTEPDDGDYAEDEADEVEDEVDGDSWTVSVTLSHHRDAKQLSDQLKSEGWRASSSWHTVEVSTRSQDDAESLVAELGVRAPGAEPRIVEE